MSPLKQRMLEDMQLRNFSTGTQQCAFNSCAKCAYNSCAGS